MSVKFKLIKQKNLGNDKDTIPEKVYAREVITEKVEFETLLQDIVEAGIPTSQVKAVLDRMNYLIRKHLLAGHTVQFGELGNFRYALGSTGVEEEKDFETDLIKNPNIVFHPGKTLQKARKDSEFQRLELAKNETEDAEENEPGGGL